MKRRVNTSIILSLIKRFKEDIEHWKGKDTPESVKEDRKGKMSLLKKLRRENKDS